MSIGSWLGIYISFYYLIIYLLVSINIFTIYLSIFKHDNSNIKNIVDIVYILHSNFHLSFIFIIALLSLAGIPPLAGFYGKLYLFFLLIQTGNYFIALYVVLFSVFSCIYYIRFIRYILFTDNVNEIPITYIHTITELQAYFIVILFFLNISFIFIQGPIIIFLDNIFIKALLCLY
jgi:NADH-quinone oxidoreductase subunit N